MHVYFTPRARASLLRMAQRWREKARIPEIFASDIGIVIARLASVPTSGQVAKRSASRVVYRMGTEKTKLHVYYVVNSANAQVTVLHVWSQLRGAPPKL